MPREKNGTMYKEATPWAVINILESLRQHGDLVLLDYGDRDTGASWGEQNDVEGTVGRSTGPNKIPLLIGHGPDDDGIGGPAMLDDCIVAITRVNDDDGPEGYVLYEHPKYHRGGPSGPVKTLGDVLRISLGTPVTDDDPYASQRAGMDMVVRLILDGSKEAPGVTALMLHNLADRHPEIMGRYRHWRDDKYRVIVTRDITESTSVEVRAMDMATANALALRAVEKATPDWIEPWETDDGSEGDAYLGDEAGAEVVA